MFHRELVDGLYNVSSVEGFALFAACAGEFLVVFHTFAVHRCPCTAHCCALSPDRDVMKLQTRHAVRETQRRVWV